jgi:ATP-dependent Clp protease ATP-binding subunit ClpX
MSHDKIICHLCFKSPEDTNSNFFKQAPKNGLPSVVICENCIELLHNSTKAIKKRSTPLQDDAVQPLNVNYSPKDIYKHLELNIVGQEDAKRAMSVAVFQHYQRIKNPGLKHKSNIMIVGPTGTGKTELARSIATFLNVPFVQVDVTTLTPRGYIGDSPEVCIEKLYAAAKEDVAAAERGIVFLDEFDKIPQGGDHGVFRAKVQSELLKIVEGDKVDIKIGSEPSQKVTIDTKNVLFITAGAFVGLEQIVTRSDEKRITIGVEQVKSSETKPAVHWTTHVLPEHLIKFGLIPEVIGRFAVTCYTKELSKDDLIRIIKEPEHSILNHYQSIFKGADINLDIDDDVLMLMAGQAILDKLGARGLKKQLETKLQNLIFDIDTYRGKNLRLTLNGVMIRNRKTTTGKVEV